MKRLDSYWYSQNVVAWMLLPISWLYCILVSVRHLLYRIKIFSSLKLTRPVIIIGNISVGGTGKTPLLIALCQLLKKHGYKPGVISRGYRLKDSSTTAESVHQVSGKDTAETVGDEPLLIVQKTYCPVVIGRNRAAAGRYLLEHNDCDIVLSDDGLQHYKLQRDLEIAVVDSTRKFGNGFCIPAGPLRERISRLTSVDIVVAHNTGVATENTVSFELVFENAVNLHSNESKALSEFTALKIHAVAGIGHPQRFFNQLRSNGLDIIEHAFPDHYLYQANDLSFDDDLVIIMTEKDAVKCKTLGLTTIWFLPVAAKLSEALETSVLSHIEKFHFEYT